MICKDCKGLGKIWVTFGAEADDIERELCETCNGTGEVFVSEYEKDKHNGRL